MNSAVWMCTVLWVFRACPMWWDLADWGGLDIWNLRVWMIECQPVEVTGVRCVGRGRKTWRECLKDDTDELGLHPEWAVIRDMWRGIISGITSKPSVEEMDVFKINDDACPVACTLCNAYKYFIMCEMSHVILFHSVWSHETNTIQQ